MSLRDWISRVSRVEPVQNHTVTLLGQSCCQPPVLILCVWSSLYPCLEVLPLVHIQSISLCAKVTAICYTNNFQVKAKFDQTLLPKCPIFLMWPFRLPLLLKIPITKICKMFTLVLGHILVQRFGIWSFLFPQNLWVGATDVDQRLAPGSTFSILQFQNCPPSNSSALFSCSSTFGRMCLHQVDHNLQGFPHKSVKPVYWAPQLFLCQRDQFASFGEFSIILISWSVILVAIYCTEIAFYIIPHIFLDGFFFPTCIFYRLTAALAGMTRLHFDLLFPFGFAVRSGSVLGEVGTTSSWLSPLNWVYCCGRTSPTDEDKPWVPSLTRFPYRHLRTTGVEEEKRRLKKMHMRPAARKMMSFWRRRHHTLLITVSQSKTWPRRIFIR